MDEEAKAMNFGFSSPMYPTADSISTSRIDEKIQSRYLIPHMASCHDFCKHGKKHDSEAEERRLNFRNFLKGKKKSGQNKQRDQVTILVSGERKTRKPAKLKATSKGQTDISNDTEILKPPSPPIHNSMASAERKKLQTPVEVEQCPVRRTTSGIGGTDHLRPLHSKASSSDTDVSELGDCPSASDMVYSKQTDTVKGMTKSTVKKPSRHVVSKAIQPKVSRVPKGVDDAKPAISLKTKTLLVRSLSKRKSSRSLAQRTQENKTPRSLRASKKDGRELLVPSTDSVPSKSSQNLIAQKNQNDKIKECAPASKIQDTPRKHLDSPSNFGQRKRRSATQTSSSIGNVLSLQPRELKSNKQKSAPHDNAPGLHATKLRGGELTPTSQDSNSSVQPRKLRSIKQKSTAQDNVSSLRPRRSFKEASTPHDGVLIFLSMKLRSIMQTSTPNDSASSLQPRRLRSIKQASSPQKNANLQSRKFWSMKRTSSVKKKEKSGANDLEYTDGAMMSEEERESNDGILVSKDDERKKWRRTATAAVRPDDDTPAPVKLKFRRGKVINLQSDSIRVKRLWFNIGSLGSENSSGNGLLWRRSFSRKKRDNLSVDCNDPCSQVQVVALKHQEVTEKKDEKSLYNQVIEETASKLVKTKKSKVKALVGAFETVISLQESKPASAVRVVDIIHE